MKRRAKRILKIAAGLILLCVVGSVFYSCATERLLEEEIRSADRDPETGIIVGTEPRTLPGKGDRACLLVHGWIGSPIDFRDLGERLAARGLTARLMLLPGHGTTPRDLAVRKGDDFLDALRAELRALKKTHDKVAVIGFSMGGALATLLAAEPEETVDRLVLVAPYYSVTYRWFYVLPAEWWNALLSPFVTWVAKTEGFQRVNRKEARGSIFSYRTTPTSSVRELIRLGRRARDPELLGRVTCPVLMVRSEGDRAACPAAAGDAFDAFGSGEKDLVTFTRSNHHILWDYDGEEAARRIADFLADEW